MDIFARGERYPRGILDQTGTWPFVGELYYRFATRVSLYKRRSARVLPGCRGLGGAADLPLLRCGFLLDYFRNCAAGGGERELPSDCGIVVRCGGSDRTLRSFQRKLDAD